MNLESSLNFSVINGSDDKASCSWCLKKELTSVSWGFCMPKTLISLFVEMTRPNCDRLRQHGQAVPEVTLMPATTRSDLSGACIAHHCHQLTL